MTLLKARKAKTGAGVSGGSSSFESSVNDYQSAEALREQGGWDYRHIRRVGRLSATLAC